MKIEELEKEIQSISFKAFEYYLLRLMLELNKKQDQTNDYLDKILDKVRYD